MKWLFYVIVFVYMFYRAVYGAKTPQNNLMVEPVTYENGENYLKVGAHKTISCKATNRNQKVEWIDPNGRVVKRLPGSRIYSQEHFVQVLRGRAPALVLTINNALVRDTGVYICKSGELEKNVSLCVIEPSDFIDTPAEVVADLGRSITLSCQAKGEPEPRIVWLRHGETITDEENSAKYKVMTKYNIQGFEGLLTITSLQPEDSGIYSCVSLQETIEDEDCGLTKTFNITLNINYPPMFEYGNNTALVYGKNNEEVDIVCAANGYPAPTYRWFKDIGDDVLYEYDKKQIKINDDGHAVLTVVANQSTFGQSFKCQATNEHGDASRLFTLLKTEKPRRPSVVDAVNATDSTVVLNVTWYDATQFPIDEFQIQFVKELSVGTKRPPKPKEQVWRKIVPVTAKMDDDNVNVDDIELGTITVEVGDLEAETDYWVRVRVLNDAGESPWTEPVLVATYLKPEVVTTTEASETEADAEPEVAEEGGNMNDSTFYGIFFAGGIFVVSFVCMFAMRMVK